MQQGRRSCRLNVDDHAYTRQRNGGYDMDDRRISVDSILYGLSEGQSPGGYFLRTLMHGRRDDQANANRESAEQDRQGDILLL